MALTVTLSGDWMHNIGNKRAVTATIAFDDSYPTGGESLTAANLGLAKIEQIRIDPKAGYVFEYDYTNSKVLAYTAPAQTHAHDLLLKSGAGGDGAASIESTGGPILRIETIGADQTVTGADSATKGGVLSATLAAAAMTEVADTTDLATLTGVRVYAIGY